MAELLFQAGQVYQQLGRFDEARAALERLIQGQEEEHYRSVDAGLRTYRGRHELALLHRRMGDAPHAAQLLAEIAEAFPAYLLAQVDLAETMLMMGDRKRARELLARIPPDDRLREAMDRLRRLTEGP